MNHSLKDILKSLKILFISKKEDIKEKEKSIFDMFFHKTLLAHTGEKALRIFSSAHPDVIIIDVDIPDMCGFELCKKIRKHNSTIPIIILSANKSEKNLFSAIRLQVIDFVVRPIKSETLIFALNQTAKYILNHGNVTVKLFNGSIYDYKAKSILNEQGKVTKLTKNEFRLMELLLSNKEKTLTKEQIESSLWAGEDVTESAFKSLFSRLRQKIGKDNIQNSFGVGYKLL